MIVPEMGNDRSRAESGLAGALFTAVQQRVLGLLFGQPDRRYRTGEIIQLADSGTGAVHRQLQRLATSGLVTVTHEGNQKLYQANRSCPIFEELHGLAVKTFGLVEPLREALRPFGERVVLAFVFGSVAGGSDRSGSDIDLMVVSDEVSHPDLYKALERAEKVLGRPVNPTVFTRAEWDARRTRGDTFVSRVAEGPRLTVVGGEDDVS